MTGGSHEHGRLLPSTRSWPQEELKFPHLQGQVSTPLLPLFIPTPGSLFPTKDATRISSYCCLEASLRLLTNTCSTPTRAQYSGLLMAVRGMGKKTERRIWTGQNPYPLEREEDYYAPDCGLQKEHSNLEVSNWSPMLLMTYSVRQRYLLKLGQEAWAD